MNLISEKKSTETLDIDILEEGTVAFIKLIN